MLTQILTLRMGIIHHHLHVLAAVTSSVVTVSTLQACMATKTAGFDSHILQCMAEVGRLESCKAEVMRRLIKDKWSDVEAVCAASHLLTPAIPPMFDAAVSDTRAPNSGQVNHLLASAHAPQQFK